MENSFASALRSRNTEELVDLLEQCFSDWWGMFLLHSLEAMKIFRAWGDDERQLLVWALIAHATNDNSNGLKLCDIAQHTSIPLETARRNLATLVAEGKCERQGDKYSMTVPPDFRKQLREQARLFAVALAACLPQVEVNTESANVSFYLRSGLQYAANIRRYVAKGSTVASVIAGMIEIESHVRLHLLKQGEKRLSRLAYNKVVEEFSDNKFHASRIAQLTGEPIERARNAMRYAETLGLVTFYGHDLCAYNHAAAKRADDSQAYTRGVKELLANFMLSGWLTIIDVRQAGAKASHA